MDPLSHALIGGLAAKTAKVSKRRFWIMSLLGMFPDIDVLANYLGGWAFVFQHRGITHSLVGIVLQALFLSWALSKWDLGSFNHRALHYSIPIAGHVLADSLTAFGVPLFSPFSFKEYSFDLLGSVNIIPILLMAAGILWLHKTDRHGWKETRVFWALWGLYLIVSLSGKAYASRVLKDSSVVAFPGAVHSLTWRAVQVDSDRHAYRTYNFNLLTGVHEKIEEVPMQDEALPVQDSLTSPRVQRFLRENRWPVARLSQSGDRWIVDWGTLLFSTQGWVRGKVRVEVTQDGKILSENKIFAFWNPSQAS